MRGFLRYRAGPALVAMLAGLAVILLEFLDPLALDALRAGAFAGFDAFAARSGDWPDPANLPVRPGWGKVFELSLSLVAATGLAIAMPYMGAAAISVVGPAMIAGYVAASAYVYMNIGLQIDPAMPAASLLATYLVGLIALLWIVPDRSRAAMRNYMDPRVAEELATNAGNPTLVGETRDLTAMFCDLRGFTGLSEKRDPAELVRLMSEIFDPLAKIIQDHGGTVDKFLGDGLMAFWGAPRHQPDHADLACGAALAIRKWLKRETQERQEAGDWPDVRIGIAVNSGQAYVGSIGGPARRHYTVLGDDINVASRIQEHCRMLSADILIGARTRELIGARYAALWVGDYDLRGRRQQISLYTLAGRHADAFNTLLEAHATLMQALQSSRMEVARAFAAQTRLLAPAVLHPLYAALLEQRGEEPPARPIAWRVRDAIASIEAGHGQDAA
ncbi:adenylate/guanylate cyclase domain-containing protein [Rhodovibrio sodomensis]|uniref:adenylate/guanylate cyclase domain-containing protein n=1 Tax=Rhodovibrio sodomensis TaxID=1088 RepID=UPI00190759BF|nr:adenylate/guanylate cyclase domain-containing protein [Rhodovibrio sodomensis]